MFDCHSVFLNKYGGPESLIYKKNTLDQLLDKEVLVKVDYSGINFADIMSR